MTGFIQQIYQLVEPTFVAGEKYARKTQGKISLDMDIYHQMIRDFLTILDM